MRGYASSALLRAVRTGDADEVKRLLGPDVDTELKLTRLRRQSRGGESALWRAMMTLRLRDRTPPVRELVEGILALDVDGEVKVCLLRAQAAGATPLHVAFFNGHEETLLLVDRCLAQAVEQGRLSLEQATRVLGDLRHMPIDRFAAPSNALFAARRQVLKNWSQRVSAQQIDPGRKRRLLDRLATPVGQAVNDGLRQRLEGFIGADSDLD